MITSDEFTTAWLESQIRDTEGHLERLAIMAEGRDYTLVERMAHEALNDRLAKLRDAIGISVSGG